MLWRFHPLNKTHLSELPNTSRHWRTPDTNKGPALSASTQIHTQNQGCVCMWVCVGQSCKRSRWHCGTSLAALCRCCLHTGFWINGSEMIYQGYPPPEHRHTLLSGATPTDPRPGCSDGDAKLHTASKNQMRNWLQLPFVSPDRLNNTKGD